MIETLATRFRRFGERECLPSSPLYARFALGIAKDPALLELASAAQAGPVPNLFFAAVQFLLLKGVPSRLAAHYPALAEASAPPTASDPFPLFRAFCLEHADSIRRLLATRRVQTNEVRRCACLLPAFVLAARQAGGRPLAIVEIGASAGLNLLWDRYGYTYGAALRCGDPHSPVQLACALRGELHPPIPATLPEIVFRVGLDLNPVDLRDPDATLWLRALIWPEQTDRAGLLARAITLAQPDPPRLLAGDALALLPSVLANAPDDAALCLFHTFTLNQFTPPARERFTTLVAEHAAARAISVISIEWREPSPPLILTTFERDTRVVRELALCDPHGAWIEWR